MQEPFILPEPQGAFFEAPGGIRGYAEIYGSPCASQHLLFLPGGYQSLSCWRYQTAVLKNQDCYTVVLDLPGHGLARTATEPYPGIYADYIASAIDAYELEAPHLIAWSFGCLLATDLLLSDGVDAPLSNVIFVGPAFPLLWDQQSVQQMLQFYPWMEKLMAPAKETLLSVAPQFVQALFGSPVSAADYDLAYGSTLRNMSHLGPEMLLHHLTLPPATVQQKWKSLSLTIIYGERDPFVHLVLDSFRTLVPHAREIAISGCGHSPHIEAPEIFNAHLRRAAIDTPVEERWNPIP